MSKILKAGVVILKLVIGLAILGLVVAGFIYVNCGMGQNCFA